MLVYIPVFTNIVSIPNINATIINIFAISYNNLTVPSRVSSFTKYLKAKNTNKTLNSAIISTAITNFEFTRLLYKLPIIPTIIVKIISKVIIKSLFCSLEAIKRYIKYIPEITPKASST